MFCLLMAKSLKIQKVDFVIWQSSRKLGLIVVKKGLWYSSNMFNLQYLLSSLNSLIMQNHEFIFIYLLTCGRC